MNLNSKNLIYIALPLVLAAFVFVAYYLTRPKPAPEIPVAVSGNEDFSSLTPEQQRKLLDKFTHPTKVQSGVSSSLSPEEKESFLNQKTTGKSALTPEERKRFLEQGR